MFHFPWFALSPLCIQDEVTGHYTRRVSPFGHFRINVRLATPRKISQPPTSFIASQRLGIHRTPFVAYNYLVLVDVDARGVERLKIEAQTPALRSGSFRRDST
jgi:hypothetical protein